MLEIVLVHPEIPPNTGNVIRLAANTGAHLHLVAPLGFSMDDRQLRRAGLDYRELANVSMHEDWKSFASTFVGRRMFALSTRAECSVYRQNYLDGDVFVFGSETSGLPEQILEEFPQQSRLRIPVVPGNRSLNLSNAVAVVVYEAWRQLGLSPGV